MRQSGNLNRSCRLRVQGVAATALVLCTIAVRLGCVQCFSPCVSRHSGSAGGKLRVGAGSGGSSENVRQSTTCVALSGEERPSVTTRRSSRAVISHTRVARWGSRVSFTEAPAAGFSSGIRISGCCSRSSRGGGSHSRSSRSSGGSSGGDGGGGSGRRKGSESYTQKEGAGGTTSGTGTTLSMVLHGGEGGPNTAAVEQGLGDRNAKEKARLMAMLQVENTRKNGLKDIWRSKLFFGDQDHRVLLKAACQVGMAPMASGILNRMASQGWKLDAPLYDEAIKASRLSKNTSLALSLAVDEFSRATEYFVLKSVDGSVSEVDRKAVEAQVQRRFNGLLAVSLKNSRLSLATKVVTCMADIGVEPTPEMGELLVAIAMETKNTINMVGLLKVMAKFSLTPAMSLTRVLERLLVAKRIEEALELLLEINAEGSNSNMASIWKLEERGAQAYAIVLKAAVEKMKRYDVVRSLVRTLFVPPPSSGSADVDLSDKEAQKNKAEMVVQVLSEVLGALASARGGGGVTATVLLEEWRLFTLGGGGKKYNFKNAKHGKPTRFAYEMAMTALVRSGFWARAQSSVDVMRADGIPPTADTYAKLLKLLLERIEPGDPTAAAAGSAGGGVRRSGDESGSRGGVVKTGKEKEKSLWEDSVSEWQEAMLLVQNVRELGADSGAASPSLVSPPGMYKTALQIFLNVSQRTTTATSMTPTSANIQQGVERLLEWADETHEQIPQQMRTDALRINENFSDSRDIYKRFEELPSGSDELKQSSLICIPAKEPRGALMRINEVQASDSSVNGMTSKHYAQKVKDFTSRRMFAKAYQVVAEAVAVGEGSQEVYRAGISACAKQPNPNQAETILGVMISLGFKPEVHTIIELLRSYGPSGDLKGIRSVIDRMQKGAFLNEGSNAFVFEALIEVLAPLKQWRIAERYVKQAESVIPGSLTHRTYGHLMTAYAMEAKWGKVIELGLGENTGMWPEDPGNNWQHTHSLTLRDTALAVALEGLLMQRAEAHDTDGIPGANSITDAASFITTTTPAAAAASAGDSAYGVVGGNGGGVSAERVRKTLKHRRCGRELFARLLASGVCLESVKVYKAALGGVGGPRGQNSPSSSSSYNGNAETQQSEMERRGETMRMMWDPEKPVYSGLNRQTLSASDDWLMAALSDGERKRERAAQNLHISTVLEAFLRSYLTCIQISPTTPGKSSTVALLQQGISAACVANDVDLAERMFESWLADTDLFKLHPEVLRLALRASFSEILMFCFHEESGKNEMFSGLALIDRCKEQGLVPYPHDIIGAMQACNSAGLCLVSLTLFDELINGHWSDFSSGKTLKHQWGHGKRQSEASEAGRSKTTSSTLAATSPPATGGGSGAVGDHLIPAAAAAIALESCFMRGDRDRAMDIVLQVIQMRYPLTGVCRNRMIVVLTLADKIDVALTLAREMEGAGHYTHQWTLNFVEAVALENREDVANAAAAFLIAGGAHGDGDDGEWGENGGGGGCSPGEEDGYDFDDDEDKEDEEDGEGAEYGRSRSGLWNSFSEEKAYLGVLAEEAVRSPVAAGNLEVDQNKPNVMRKTIESLPSSDAFALRLLPVLVEALRERLRPGGSEGGLEGAWLEEKQGVHGLL